MQLWGERSGMESKRNNVAVALPGTEQVWTTESLQVHRKQWPFVSWWNTRHVCHHPASHGAVWNVWLGVRRLGLHTGSATDPGLGTLNRCWGPSTYPKDQALLSLAFFFCKMGSIIIAIKQIILIIIKRDNLSENRWYTLNSSINVCRAIADIASVPTCCFTDKTIVSNVKFYLENIIGVKYDYLLIWLLNTFYYWLFKLLSHIFVCSWSTSVI